MIFDFKTGSELHSSCPTLVDIVAGKHQPYHSASLQQRRLSHRQASTSGGTGEAQYVLGIESSCDDTGVAVLRTSDGAVLGHSIASQVRDSLARWHTVS